MLANGMSPPRMSESPGRLVDHAVTLEVQPPVSVAPGRALVVTATTARDLGGLRVVVPVRAW